jgi:cullin 3
VGVIAANNRAETERERRETEKKNDEQRNYIVEAAIVRIMKCVTLYKPLRFHANIRNRQRKTLTHEQLLLETVSQLSSRFKPEIPMIKSRIENLIEREYLERIEDSNPAAYKYLA